MVTLFPVFLDASFLEALRDMLISGPVLLNCSGNFLVARRILIFLSSSVTYSSLVSKSSPVSILNRVSFQNRVSFRKTRTSLRDRSLFIAGGGGAGCF